jgi:hypothetical protein
VLRLSRHLLSVLRLSRHLLSGLRLSGLRLSGLRLSGLGLPPPVAVHLQLGGGKYDLHGGIFLKIMFLL